MKILTAAEMARIDRLTAEGAGISSLDLMENAGSAVVQFLEDEFGPLGQHKIVALCGKGNNGGDGMVAARHLHEMGFTPHVFLLADPQSLRGDAATNYGRLTALMPVQVVQDYVSWGGAVAGLDGTTMVLDALLGTGLSKPLEGFLLEVVQSLPRVFPTARIVAVDLPSGLSADTGELIGECVHADACVTFTAPKLAHIFSPACEQIGKWVVRSIGTPPELLESDPTLWLNLLEGKDVSWLAERRRRDTHKGTYGHVLVLGGSVGKTGAAAMCARAALRAGAGLATVATAKIALPMIASYSMEVMTEALPETEMGTVSTQALESGRLDRIAEGKDVLAVGPGLGSERETASLVRAAVNKFPQPVVLDADGLNAFAGCTSTLQTVGRVRVLTPHPGEFARLTGLQISEILGRRVEVARQFARQRGVYLVLKGYRTIVASPDGTVRVNPTGNPGMATGGAGDVLTGIMASLLAQYPTRPVSEVVAAAVYLHGLAGDCAAWEKGEASLVAGDIIESLPAAFRSLSERTQ
jgi:NAD(P)H-hydrate epimerase